MYVYSTLAPAFAVLSKMAYYGIIDRHVPYKYAQFLSDLHLSHHHHLYLLGIIMPPSFSGFYTVLLSTQYTVAMAKTSASLRKTLQLNTRI